jgi:hypothetical protein
MKTMTPELRTALINGEAYGYPSVASAPENIQNRIAELRFALVNKPRASEYSNGHSSIVAASAVADADLRLKLKLQGDEIRKQAAEQKKAEQKLEDGDVCPTCGQTFTDEEDDDEDVE